jgi:hypothetical protein
MSASLTVALALTIGTLGSSCAFFQGAGYYTPRFPVIPKPERPDLVDVSGDEVKKMSPEAQKAVVDNTNALMDYAKKLEVGIDEYNKFASEKNKAFEPEEVNP